MNNQADMTIKNDPIVPPAPLPGLPERVIEILTREMREFRKCQVTVLNSGPIFYMKVADVAIEIDNGASPFVIAHVARDLGLNLIGMPDGYVVCWNKAQLDVLTLTASEVQ